MGKILLKIDDSLHKDLKIEAVKKDIHLKDYITKILKKRARWVGVGTQYTNKKQENFQRNVQIVNHKE